MPQSWSRPVPLTRRHLALSAALLMTAADHPSQEQIVSAEAARTKLQHRHWLTQHNSPLPTELNGQYCSQRSSTSLPDTCPELACPDWLQGQCEVVRHKCQILGRPKNIVKSNISSATPAKISCCGWHVTPGTELTVLCGTR